MSPLFLHPVRWLRRAGAVGIALGFWIAALGGRAAGAGAAEAVPSQPWRDPAGHLFRNAPMERSTRSVSVSLTTNLHAAFDSELLRIHTVWEGAGLALYGPPYHGEKSPFIARVDGRVAWTFPAVHPWSSAPGSPFDKAGVVAPGRMFRGMSTSGGRVTFLYEIVDGAGRALPVRETWRPVVGQGHVGITRRLELPPRTEPLWWTAHVEPGRVPEGWSGKTGTMRAVERDTGFLLAGVTSDLAARWEVEEGRLEFSEAIVTEAGADQGWSRREVSGPQVQLRLKIPPGPKPGFFEVTTMVGPDQTSAGTLAAAIETPAATVLDGEPRRPDTFRADPRAVAGVGVAGGDEFYRIEPMAVPAEAMLQVTGMDFLPGGGDLAVCTWRGDVFRVTDVTGPPEAVRYRRFASGLNEPLGVLARGTGVLVLQKHELTRLTDTDADGAADLFETVCNGWGYTGSYHAFAFGPAVDRHDRLVVALCGQRGRWDVPYLGWAVRLGEDGRSVEPWCSGLRAPNGLGTFGPQRDLFATDNQGNFIGACKLNHLKAGAHYGFPSAWPAPRSDWGRTREFTPPAVWFPRKLAPSASAFVEVTDARFGPFQGQMLVGDFQNAVVLRVMLEQVDGEWQGAVTTFARGFLSGVNRLAFGPDGCLYVGGLKNKAWPSAGPREWSLDRVRFTGRVPFEVVSMSARPNGFELAFTHPVDPAVAADPEAYAVSQFSYRHHAAYGSPEFDHEGRPNRWTPVAVRRAVPGTDGRSVRLECEGLRDGFVTVLRAAELKSADGAPLRHPEIYYTLNRRPARHP